MQRLSTSSTNSITVFVTDKPNGDYYLRASSSLTPDTATRNVDANADGGKQIEGGEERKKHAQRNREEENKARGEPIDRKRREERRANKHSHRQSNNVGAKIDPGSYICDSATRSASKGDDNQNCNNRNNNNNHPRNKNSLHYNEVKCKLQVVMGGEEEHGEDKKNR